MNADTITMATGPLVTEQAGVPSGLVFGFFLVMAGLLIGVVVVSVVTETEAVTAGGLLAGIALALVLMCFGISSIVGATKGEPFRVNVLSEERVTEVISDHYRITSIEDYEGLVAKEALCKPVSSESPEYTGVAQGQQIRFKVGSTNCESDNPDIRIIVTDTSGTALDAEKLRR